MQDKDTQVNTQAPVAPATVVPAVANKVTPGRKMRDSARAGTPGARSSSDTRGRGGRTGGGRGSEPRERVKPEFDAKMIDIRRVTRVSSGGRRYSFSVAVVAGDRKGRVGVGLGKAGDTSLAIEKATREAKKHLVKVPLSAQMTIPHATSAKFGSARIMVFPARGSGIVAGSSARTVIELAGIKDVCAKIMSGSKNKVNIARAIILAFDNLSRINRRTLQNKAPKVAAK
ncbi:MAG TPA: 30S ribosomal protein S5 [Candidatus Paceibacterota bacterium]|jgi:small subunit ribosomal protein S5|nr:30S ribosomal protein S5 [Candidatus Paceibacterota bacterium]